MSPGNPLGSQGHTDLLPWASCISRVLAVISSCRTAVLLAASLLEAVECPSQMRCMPSITFSEKALPPESARGRIAMPALWVWETHRVLGFPLKLLLLSVGIPTKKNL